MGRGPSLFRKTDVARLVAAARAAGLEVMGVKVDVHRGTIEVVTGESEVQDSNPWDRAMEELKQ
jgi:hypothetical protein